MPNNNPQQTTSQGSRTEGSSKIADRVEKTAERIEKTAENTAHAALERVRDVRERATSGIEEQRALLASRIHRLGGVLRAGSETLSTDDPMAQRLLTSAGQRVEILAEYIENAHPQAVVEDVQTFARRRPGVFFGGAFLIGLALGRFAKSTTRAVTSSSGSDTYGEDEESFSEGDYSTSYAAERSGAGYGQTSAQQTSVRSESPSSYGTTTRSAGPQGARLPYSGSTTAGTLAGGSTQGLAPTTSSAPSSTTTSSTGAVSRTPGASSASSSTSGTSSASGMPGTTSGASAAKPPSMPPKPPTTSSASPSSSASTSTSSPSTSTTTARETDKGEGAKS